VAGGTLIDALASISIVGILSTIQPTTVAMRFSQSGSGQQSVSPVLQRALSRYSFGWLFSPTRGPTPRIQDSLVELVCRLS